MSADGGIAYDTRSPDPVWFLAHPVAGDERFSYADNMAHILTLTRLAALAGVLVIAPYHTLCLALDDFSAVERAIGVRISDATVRHLGRLILSGHKRSAGMQRELEIVTSLYTHSVNDVIGVPDREFAKAIR
jgi:hypothetical protein